MTELDKRKTNKQEHDSILGASCLENTRIIKKKIQERKMENRVTFCVTYITLFQSPQALPTGKCIG